MHTRSALTAAMLLALGSASASAGADEIVGPVSNIDLAADTFAVGGKMFIASHQYVKGGGVNLHNLKEGDEVKVEFAGSEGSDGEPIHSMALNRVE